MKLAKTVSLSTHIAYAVAKLKARQYDAAYSYADKACRFSDQRFAPALSLRAHIQSCRGDQKSAINDYLLAFAQSPEQIEPLERLASLSQDPYARALLAKAISLYLRICPHKGGDAQFVPLLKPLAQTSMGAVWQTDANTLMGWAVSPEPAPVTVEIDRNRWTLTPSLPTPSLHAQGIGTGNDGFIVRLPQQFTVCRLGVGGISLWGSPIGREKSAPAMAAVRTGSLHREPRAATIPDAPVDIIIPVYSGVSETLACLDTLRLYTTPGTYRAIVVNDASPDAQLNHALRERAQQGEIILIERAFNVGFVGAVNTALMVTANDVVLLNADTLLTENWLSRLQQAAYSAADIGTATPMSNHAELLSHPIPMVAGKAQEAGQAQAIAVLFAQSAAREAIDIPVGVGFCLYIKREVLDQIGALNETEIFRGYAEETDFCLRASALGWRHVCAPRVYIGHQGSVSFSSEKQLLAPYNVNRLKLRYPEHSHEYQRFLRKDPLKKHRRELQRQWLAHTQAGQGRACRLHDPESYSRHRPYSDNADISLSLIIEHSQGQPWVELIIQGVPGLRAIQYRGPQIRKELCADLKASGISHLIIGAGAEWPHAWLTLLTGAFPYHVILEDYSAWCPRRYLLQENASPCSDPLADEDCTTCLETHGPLIPQYPGLKTWRRRQHTLLQQAASITAPAKNLLQRYQRRFPGLPILHRRQYRPRPRPQTAPRCLVVPSLQHPHHGYRAFLAHARQGLASNAATRYIVFGDVMEPRQLVNLSNVHLLGPVPAARQIEVIKAHRAEAILDCAPWPGDPLAWGGIAAAAELPLVHLHG